MYKAILDLLTLAILILWIIVIYRVFVKKEKLSTTISWCLTLLLFPLLCLYLHLWILWILMFILWIIGSYRVHKKKAPQPESKFERQIDEKGFPKSLLTKYEPIDFLGEGGFAKVFKVRKKSNGKIVAVKIPKVDEKTGKIFLTEVSSWLQLHHENIVKLYDADIYPIPHMEMEFVEGVYLKDRLCKSLEELPKPLETETALAIVFGVARGLKYAHAKGIAHRDLKPSNILLASIDLPKITDWGLAKIGISGSDRSVIGYTPLYAAPEHLMPSRYGSTDFRTDIWQLGIIFYELITGRLPFEGYSYEEVFGKIVDEKYNFKLPSDFDGKLRPYDKIIRKMLARDKSERYQSVDEFLSELEKLESEEKQIQLEYRIKQLNEILRKSIEGLKLSKSSEEIFLNKRIVVETLCNLAIAYAEHNRRAELLNTLIDLKSYTNKNINELLSAIQTVELMIRERVNIKIDFLERLKVLLHRIKREHEIFEP